MTRQDLLSGQELTGDVPTALAALSNASQKQAVAQRRREKSVGVPAGDFLVGPHSGNVALSLVLPTFNESKNIRAALQIVCQVLRLVKDLTFEVIVVDDNSPDGTAELALEEADVLPEVSVMKRTGESGLATAVIRGWQASQGQFLAVMDSDLQHPPEVLATLALAMRGGADLAVGSRHVELGGVSDWSFARRIISRTAQMIGLVILPEVVGRVADPMSGYFMLRRDVISGKLLNPTGYKILLEVLARGSAQKITEAGYVFCERREGESKVTAAIYRQYVEHLLRLRVDLLRESQFARFCLVGLSGTALDMILLYLLSDPATLALGLTRSKLLAAEAAMANNFYWNDRFTFHGAKAGRLQRFLKFNAVCLVGVAINLMLLNIQFNVFGINRYVANAAAIGVTTFWNFFVNRRIGWRSSAETQS